MTKIEIVFREKNGVTSLDTVASEGITAWELGVAAHSLLTAMIEGAPTSERGRDQQKEIAGIAERLAVLVGAPVRVATAAGRA